MLDDCSSSCHQVQFPAVREREGEAEHTHTPPILGALTGSNADNFHLLLLARTQLHGHLIEKKTRKCSFSSGQPHTQPKFRSSFIEEKSKILRDS